MDRASIHSARGGAPDTPALCGRPSVDGAPTAARTIGPIHQQRSRDSQPFTMPYLTFRAAGIPSDARMPSRIPRGFLEREANVKQTNRFFR